jgi:transposase
LNQLFALNRKVFKAYLLKESLDRLWSYHYEGAMLNYLQGWIDQLRWQRLEPFRKLANMLPDHLDGILNYCRTRVPMGVVEAVKYQITATQRTRLQEPALPAAQGAAHGSDQDRIRGVQKGA